MYTGTHMEPEVIFNIQKKKAPKVDHGKCLPCWHPGKRSAMVVRHSVSLWEQVTTGCCYCACARQLCFDVASSLNVFAFVPLWPRPAFRIVKKDYSALPMSQRTQTPPFFRLLLVSSDLYWHDLDIPWIPDWSEHLVDKAITSTTVVCVCVCVYLSGCASENVAIHLLSVLDEIDLRWFGKMKELLRKDRGRCDTEGAGGEAEHIKDRLIRRANGYKWCHVFCTYLSQWCHFSGHGGWSARIWPVNVCLCVCECVTHRGRIFYSYTSSLHL